MLMPSIVYTVSPCLERLHVLSKQFSHHDLNVILELLRQENDRQTEPRGGELYSQGQSTEKKRSSRVAWRGRLTSCLHCRATEQLRCWKGRDPVKRADTSPVTPEESASIHHDNIMLHTAPVLQVGPLLVTSFQHRTNWGSTHFLQLFQENALSTNIYVYVQEPRPLLPTYPFTLCRPSGKSTGQQARAPSHSSPFPCFCCSYQGLYPPPPLPTPPHC